MDAVQTDAMSLILSRRATVAMMMAMALAGSVGLVAWGPVGLVPHMHHFADEGVWLGVPNGRTVLTHLPLVPAGLWGLRQAARLPEREPLRRVWACFFVCQLAATIGGMAYHLAPSDAAFVWDQLPKSATSTLFALAFLGECVDRRCASTVPIVFGLGACLLGGAWWLLSLYGLQQGDLRPLMWLEFLPIVLVGSGAWNLTGHLLERSDWMRSQVSFFVAQAADWSDAWVHQWTDGLMGGHSLRHLALAACVGWVSYRLGCGESGSPTPATSPAPTLSHGQAEDVPQSIEEDGYTSETSLPLTRLAN